MLKTIIGRPVASILDRIASAIAAIGVPPNFITWSSLVLNLWAGVMFAAGRFFAGGCLMIGAGFCDMVDGPVARKQGRVSLFGAFLESILDRYSDLILFLGLLVYYALVNRFLYAVLAGAAMAGSVMVSYAEARAESLIDNCKVGFWERPERFALMIVAGLSNHMELALWILAIGPNITVIHRILYTWKQTNAGRQPLPQKVAATAERKVPSGSQVPGDMREATILTRSAGGGA
jgi:CDP-diacylglycerol---glycerol-3-phosphate 3-phosphatidyltransferase